MRRRQPRCLRPRRPSPMMTSSPPPSLPCRRPFSLRCAAAAAATATVLTCADDTNRVRTGSRLPSFPGGPVSILHVSAVAVSIRVSTSAMLLQTGRSSRDLGAHCCRCKRLCGTMSMRKMFAECTFRDGVSFGCALFRYDTCTTMYGYSWVKIIPQAVVLLAASYQCFTK